MKYIILFFGLVAICKAASFSGRIINSIPSASDDAYAISVYSAAGGQPFPAESYLSTGVAISELYVLATGQAIYGFGSWRIGVNTNNRGSQDIMEVDDYYLHGQFDSATLQYNIGVLKVRTPIRVYISVATEETTFPVLFTIGFGYNDDQEQLPPISQQAAAHLIEAVECRLTFNQRVIRPTNFCANTVARLASGDQGGPAVNFLRTQCYGIVSFWNPTNATHNPAVFTNLAHPDIRSFLAPFL